MIEKIIALHFNISIFLNQLSLSYSSIKKIVLFFAKEFDFYVIVFAFLSFSFLLIRSLKRHSVREYFLLFVEGAQILISILFAWGLSFLIKNITKVPRPYLAFPEQIHALFSYGSYNSFPSGHATLFIALATILFLYHKRLGFLFFLFAFLISVARVMAGIHYPIDIFFGWILGFSLAFLTHSFVEKIKKNLLKKK